MPFHGKVLHSALGPRPFSTFLLGPFILVFRLRLLSAPGVWIMKLGIVGLPQSGKSTTFAALTGARGQEGDQKSSRPDHKMGTLRVADERVDFLTQIYKPKKTTYAQVEYLLPSQPLATAQAKTENLTWNQIRICDALVHVVRNFVAPGGIKPDAEADYQRLEEEMILCDLAVAEKRIERIEMDNKRGKKPPEEEYALIKQCKEILEQGNPIRAKPELAEAQVLRGFTFLSAKPQLVIINNDDTDDSTPEWKTIPPQAKIMVVRSRIEMDIASMSLEEAADFMKEYKIEKSALDRVIRSSYSLLNLISFFTVLNEEVRAWTIKKGSPAVEAAGAVHSDMKKGFIRAEVLPFEHLRKRGSFQDAKQKGLVRLEGKGYIVQDGDIINFRFNV
jgi:ribosome-binding ATPase